MSVHYERLISADSHIFEDAHLWEKTLGDRFGDEIPHHVPEYMGKKGNYFYTGRHYFLRGDQDKEYRGNDQLTRAGYEPCRADPAVNVGLSEKQEPTRQLHAS